LCFEHNLCTQLVSNDAQQIIRDNEQQNKLFSSLHSTDKEDAKTPQRSESHVEEKLLKPKRSVDYSHLIYEPIVPVTQSVGKDDSGKKPSIKRSPSLSKIEEEDSVSNASEKADSPMPSKLPPVKVMPLQDFPHHIIKSPLLAAIEEESIGSSVSSSPKSVSCSPTTVNRGIMQSLMDQKIEHASRDDDWNATPLEADLNSDLSSVSLDPAIWSDSEAEQITITEESPRLSKQQSKLEEKEITPAMKAIGSVCILVFPYCVSVQGRTLNCSCNSEIFVISTTLSGARGLPFVFHVSSCDTVCGSSPLILRISFLQVFEYHTRQNFGGRKFWRMSHQQ